MKIIFPKTIKILSYTFDIIIDKENGGGSFDFGEGTITIGTKYIKQDPSSVFNIICHEVLEAIACATNTRYNDTSVSGNYKFFMDHKEFELNTNLFAITIQNFIK